MKRRTCEPRRLLSVAAVLAGAGLLGLFPTDPVYAAGKQPASGVSKHIGKPAAVVLPTGSQRARPLTLASVGKAAALAPSVRTAMVALAGLSAAPPQIRVDPRRGGLTRFRGQVANPHGTGLVAATMLLHEHKDALGLLAAPGKVALVQREVIAEANDGLHLVLDVTYAGLPVWGAEVAAHFAADGTLTAINAQRLSVLAPAMQMRYGGAAAQQRARRWNAAGSGDGAVRDLNTPELGVWPGDDIRPAAWTWRLVQSVDLPDGTPQHYATYVDSNDGRVIARHALVATEKVTPTTGVAVNMFDQPITLRISHYESSNVFGLFDQSKGLAAATIYTFNAQHSENKGALATSANKNQWSKPLATAHEHMQQVVDYFRQTHARNSWDGKGAQVRQLVHFGVAYNNAFWDSWNKHMALGDGDGYFFKSFTRALDVSAHEYAHAVITGTVNLVYQGQPGALNESFADVMSVMVDRDDWLIGEEIVGADAFPLGYARSLATPEGGNQPAHMDDLYKGLEDYGGVHINSGIPNHAAYVLAQARSRELVEKVWYRTLYKHHIGTQASFVDMAEGTMTACDELAAAGQADAGDCTEVAKAWVAVGVLGAADVPMNGCPTNASEKGGLCYCDPGHVPNNDGSACVALGNVECPANSIQINGQCFCQEGFKPNADSSQCVAIADACPLNASWDLAAKACVCNEGFEGAANAADGKCEVIPSDCPDDSHPEWPDPQQQDDYLCVCNQNYQDDGEGGCEVVPGTCGNESFYGRCDGDTLIYCQLGDEDSIAVVDCAADDLVCGKFDSIIGFDCLNPDGVGPGGTCEADGYQECGASVPFCVSEVDAATGFCSHECKAKPDCEATPAETAAFDCCATVSDGTRACLKDPYCADNIDTKATCDDVPGGSTYYGKCVGDVLIYCDGSTATTQEVFCATLGLECRWVDKTTGYSCVEPNSGALPEAPPDWCPHENDGHCDVPELCPVGSDLFDCNPCGEVTADGRCMGNTLQVCDSAVGLVGTPCDEQGMMASCVVGEDGVAACVPDEDGDSAVPTEGGGDDTVTQDDTDDSAGGGGGSFSCTCRSDDAGQPGGAAVLGLLALGLASLRRRRRTRPVSQ